MNPLKTSQLEELKQRSAANLLSLESLWHAQRGTLALPCSAEAYVNKSRKQESPQATEE